MNGKQVYRLQWHTFTIQTAWEVFVVQLTNSFKMWKIRKWPLFINVVHTFQQVHAAIDDVFRLLEKENEMSRSEEPTDRSLIYDNQMAW
ncbi:hypothetical protein DPMN_150160 [Dreissena polymorpha]|uniref:Uncharacterized protein n=1 Tax=Dreissena polymorpha TaxID=45954 RepID=A0A9D4FEW5_DREPO|nr:hypothetical protein DPMN_150160 [Dreissena polymorpha]